MVSLRGLCITIFLAELNLLELWCTDIGNAYLEAYTDEKLYVVAGGEFGELAGNTPIINKALYGLQMSGKRWWERFSEILSEMGFKASKAELDIWMRKAGDHYEYIAQYVDDLAIASVGITIDTWIEIVKLKGTVQSIITWGVISSVTNMVYCAWP